MDQEETNNNSPVAKYTPNKRQREVRARVYTRWTDMRSDPLRKEAELDWDEADKNFKQFIGEIDPDDWRSHLELPDGFSGVQVYMQETIERLSRPFLTGHDDVLGGPEKFCNAIMNYNMDNTGWDLQHFYAKLCAAIRGTAYVRDYYRIDKRKVRDLDSVDEEGNIVYKEKTIVDFEDDYMEWIDNQWFYMDPGAKNIDEAADCFRREVMTIDAFHLKYDNRAEFMNTQFVFPGGDISRNTRYFQMPEDLNAHEVEVLHYENRDADEYEVLANNVVIRDDPLPSKHKELGYAVYYHYRIPGQPYGMGVYKVMKSLTEERKAIRRLNLDRQKLQLQKMFLHNSAFDIDEDDLESRPGGLISVETNGQPIQNALTPVEYGDVPDSYFKTEEIILEDIRRATGFDDRIQGVQTGGTATEAAILKESSMKRINMVSFLTEMDTIVRLGRLKWSNIQFFYQAKKISAIISEDDEDDSAKYHKIRVEGMEFSLQKAKDGSGKEILDMKEVDGPRVYELNPKYNKFMEGDFRVTMASTVYTPTSKALKQAKNTEMLTTFGSNPLLMAAIDPNKAVKRTLQVNDEEPDDWMKNAYSPEQWQEEADREDSVMSTGIPLAPTPNAPAIHTLVHINFMSSVKAQRLPRNIRQVILDHILAEHDANPQTGSSADLLKGFGINGPTGAPGANPNLPLGGVEPGSTVDNAPAPQLAAVTPGAPQTADITPANNNPAPE